VQEALRNIEKHAQARDVAIAVRKSQGRRGERTVLLVISDDGAGLPQERVFHGLGMQGMRERAAVIEADLQFIDAEGVTVRIEIPVDNGEVHHG
jgi:signal transduction histidine kinase